MRKILIFTLALIMFLLSINNPFIDCVFASPQTALTTANLAEKLLLKLQNFTESDNNIEKLYRYLDILYSEDTQFFCYKIKELEKLMEKYREDIILKARELAQKEEYKQAVEFLENKSGLFKDKTILNSLISFYSKFYIQDGLYYCELEPEIISINKLIAYPNIAFKNNPNLEEIDNKYLTNKEFQSLLNELYYNDYILIGINDYIDITNDISTKKDLYLPRNKKPLILIFNNANYCNNECFVDKYIIDGQENIATFSAKQTENNQISYENDFIPILENFISLNQDFSFNNNRAVISFYKNQNILGYDISKSNPNYNNDILSLKKLATKLAEIGYNFSLNYSINNYYNILNPEEEINEISENLLSIFPNLNTFFSQNSNNSVNTFYKLLYEIGFRFFIDFSNNTLLIKNDFTFLSCKQIDGKFLREKSDYLGLNYEAIYDHNNRSIIY